MDFFLKVAKSLLKTIGSYKEINPFDDEPLVSVILPSYNYSKYVGKTIDSIFNQSYKNWELIVVDDCSKDDSVDIIKRKIISYKDRQNRVVLIKNRINQGLPKVYAKAFKIAKGKYVAFIDADDYWQPDNLKFKVSVLENFSNIALVYSQHNEFQSELNIRRFGNKIPVLFSIGDHNFFFKPKIFSFSLVVIRKNILDKISMNLPKKYFVLCDWWVYFQVARKGDLAKISLELVSKRVHSLSYSTSFFANNNQNNFFSEFREYLRKRFIKMNRGLFALMYVLYSIDWNIRRIFLKLLNSKIIK